MCFARADKDYLDCDKSLNAKVPWLCAYLEINPGGELDGHGGEAVQLNGNPVGSTTSVVYGHRIQDRLARGSFQLKPGHQVAFGNGT